MKKNNLIKMVKEEVRQVLREWFPNKEEFIFFEKLESQQQQIYPDAADVGITPDHRDYDKIKPNILEMVKTFGSKNDTHEYGRGNKSGTAKLFIPIEKSDYAQGKTDGYSLEVTFTRDSQLKTRYRKSYDSFFTIYIQHISITDEEAKKQYGAKSGTDENIKEDDHMLGLGMSGEQLGKIKDTSKDKFWMGEVPETDDFSDPIKDEFIDGKTRMGPWALMSKNSFKQHGVGIGQGKGQLYKKESNGQWKKIKG